ncbi:hypothetical protein [Paraburkholderia unamae]|uniref:Uncharacterized protein n=1 Tax=Paraburkholderia unamae TaxID=219649 RepID=A0ACC6RRD0_9BURK
MNDETKFDLIEAAHHACGVGCEKALKALHPDTAQWVLEMQSRGAIFRMSVMHSGDVWIDLWRDGEVLLRLLVIDSNGRNVVFSPPASMLPKGGN